MIQEQTWQDFGRILITDEEHHGSVQVEIPYEQGKIANGKADAYIYALWVDKEYRRHEAGKRLLETAEEQARQNGARSVALGWDGRDTPRWVLHWYERQGYEEKEFGRNRSLLVKKLV